MSRRQIVAVIGLVCVLPIAVVLALGPSALFDLESSTGPFTFSILGYAIEFLGTAGIILLLVAWLGMTRRSMLDPPGTT